MRQKSNKIETRKRLEWAREKAREEIWSYLDNLYMNRGLFLKLLSQLKTLNFKDLIA